MEDQVELVDVTPAEWPDACLGVVQPDVACAQVITPGFRVLRLVNGTLNDYHTNLDGSAAVQAIPALT